MPENYKEIRGSLRKSEVSATHVLHFSLCPGCMGLIWQELRSQKHRAEITQEDVLCLWLPALLTDRF